VKFGKEEAKFISNQCHVSPLRGEKPQNLPVSKLNTGDCALRNTAGKDRVPSKELRERHYIDATAKQVAMVGACVAKRRH